MNKNEIKICHEALNKFGQNDQQLMAIEEMAELIVELCHQMRGRSHNVVEEIADVQIMMEQMQELHGRMSVPLKVTEKLKRLKKILED